MLYELASFAPDGAAVCPDDITMVLAVRLHDGNPWVLERLRVIAGHYDPLPRVVVVDFGSQGAHAHAIEGACADAGFDLVHVDDTGTFSAARARNLGAMHAETPLVFFNDIDCFGERDLFARLAAAATAIDMTTCFDQLLTVPCYHLTRDATDQVSAVAPGQARATTVGRLMAHACYSARDAVTEFVAPYSNVLLCHRRFFELLGGFNESFRGHGSEDFEFLLRFARTTRQFPWPEQVVEDVYGPIGIGFHAPDKAYRGFRRLLDVMGLQAETLGLRVAHLHHERGSVADRWSADHDRSRERFRAELARFIAGGVSRLECDWLARPKRALALVTGPPDVPRLEALRLAGYCLVPVDMTAEVAESKVRVVLRGGDVSAVVAVLGDPTRVPRVRSLLDEARAAGTEVVTITPGILEDSWHYQVEVAAERDGPTTGPPAPPTNAELDVARDYVARADAATLAAVRREATAHALDVADDAGLVRFTAQLLFRSYAFFRNAADGAGTPTEASEADVMYAWALAEPLVTRRAVLSRRFDLSSYAAGRIALGPVRSAGGPGVYGHGIDRPQAAGTITRRLRKLARDPKRFLEESRVPSLRWLGRRLPR